MTVFAPVRGLVDIEALERVPLEERIDSWNANFWVRRGLRLDPGKVALQYFVTADPTSKPIDITYAALRCQVVQAANLFHHSGVGPGDAVIYLLPTLPELYVTMLAGLEAGIACGLNWMLKPPQTLELLRGSRAKAVVALGPTPGYEIWENLQSIRAELGSTMRIFSVPGPGGTRLDDSDFARSMAEQPSDRLIFDRPIGREDIAAYVHSGGTTDSPKLVKITHGGLVYKVWANTYLMAHGSDEVMFADYPMFHIAGFYGRGITAMADGMRMVLPTPLGARNKEFIANYWKFVARCEITSMTGVPTTLSVLAKNPPRGEDVSSLRPFMSTGSTAMPVEVARELEKSVGVRVLLTYGATEYTANVTQAPRDGEPRYGSAGIRLPYTNLRAVRLDEAGKIERDCATGEIGVILVKGPGVTPGYVDPRYNQGLFTADGWFISGDLGRFDAEGYLWLTGRVKDVIIRGGHNIDASLIEDVLRRHTAVVLAAAVSKPDAYAGELPVAYVELVNGARVTAEALKAFVREHITERSATPDEIFLVDQLPLTDIGKPDKIRLRQDAAMRTFRGVLAETLGRNTEVVVTVRPDPSQGTIAVMRIKAAVDKRAEIAAAIARVMKDYTMPYRIEWGDA
jgi:fatty-acyl-CoA synthase